MKQCPKCENVLAEDAFTKNQAREDGLSAWCRACTAAYRKARRVVKPDDWVRKTADMTAYMREYFKKNPEKRRAKDRRKYENKRLREDPTWVKRQPLSIEERKARKRERNREKNRLLAGRAKTDPVLKQKQSARRTLQKAVARGKVVPQPCVECGGKAEAHHPDYARPLDVVWLCPEHHRELHRKSE